MKIIKVYDNGGETMDRYTVVVDEHNNMDPELYDCLGMSGSPTHPQGFSQWSSCILGTHMGKEIRFDELPENIQSHVKYRLGEVTIEKEEWNMICKNCGHAIPEDEDLRIIGTADVEGTTTLKIFKDVGIEWISRCSYEEKLFCPNCDALMSLWDGTLISWSPERV